MNKPTHEKIYLVPEDGIYCWSTTPAPGAQHESNDAVEYVRGDLFESMKAERDVLAHRLNDVSIACKISNAMIDETEAERDALAAQNKILLDALNLALPSVETCYKQDMATWETLFLLREAVNATPQQCLRDVQAEAGRAGFFAAINLVRMQPERANHAVFVCQKAEEYTATVRQGGAG